MRLRISLSFQRFKAQWRVGLNRKSVELLDHVAIERYISKFVEISSREDVMICAGGFSEICHMNERAIAEVM